MKGSRSRNLGRIDRIVRPVDTSEVDGLLRPNGDSDGGPPVRVSKLRPDLDRVKRRSRWRYSFSVENGSKSLEHKISVFVMSPTFVFGCG